MPIILVRNLDSIPTTDFASEVGRRAAAASRTGAYDFVYIVPTRRRVRELQRDLVKDVSFGVIPIYTLELFAREIFLSMSMGRRVITPSMQGMLVGRVLSEGDFKFFRYASYRPGSGKGVAPVGTVKKIVDQIGYLEENGITPEDYEAMASAAEDSERLKIEEFGAIYSSYLKLLGERLVDSAGLLSLVNAELSMQPDFFSGRYPGDRTFFIEGFYNFKKPELDFLRLVSSEKRFSFLLKLDCDESNANLFRTMISTSNDLVKRGFRIVDGRRAGDNIAAARPPGFLAAHLFADDPPGRRLDLRSEVFVAGMRDKLRETEFVAEKIKQIVRKNPGQKLDRICVASYLPQDYSRLFREVFRKYRIPSNITDRYTLESSGIVNAVLSFLDIKITDYERTTLLRAVTNGTIRLSNDFTPGEAGSAIYNAARLCRFERGFNAFKEAINSRLRLFEGLTGSDSDLDTAGNARDAETLRTAARVLDTIESTLAVFNGDLSPGEFRNSVKRVVGELGVRENIARADGTAVPTEFVERDARALSAFLEVIDEITEVESERGNQKIPPAVWMDSLRSALSLTRYNIRQKYGYGVYVTSLEEIRGLEFDFLFVVGLNEGELPARYDPEIFLPHKYQEENRETEPYLQRHLFYQAASSFRKELYLVHPLQRDEVRLVRSSFVDAMLQAAEVTILQDATQADGNIYNIHQLIEAESSVPDAREKIAADRIAAAALPSNLERCKTAERARYRGEKDSEFTGKLTVPLLIASLKENLEKRIFSAAQLETLSRCGFQFFASRILQVEETPEIETSLSSLERGAVLHRIFYRFYSELARLGRLEKAKDEIELLISTGRSILDGLGMSAGGSFGRDLFEVEREAILGTGDQPGTLHLFLSKVQSKLAEYGFVPRLFETGFGMKSGDGSMLTGPVDVGGVLLQGKVDRIDTLAGGMTIFDYKTTARNPAHQDVVRDKISPQLLIYLDALSTIRELLNVADNVSGAAFISINRDRLMRSEDGSDLIEFIVREESGTLKYQKSFKGSKRTPAAETYPSTMEELLKQTELFVGELVGRAKSGRFNLTEFPYEKVCAYCPYAEACRIALTREAAETA